MLRMKSKLIFSFVWMFFMTQSIYALDLSREKLTEETLSLIYEYELDYMRNEIYARKGYVFSNEKYQNYFKSCSWYTPAPDNKSIKLSAIETFNVELLKQQSEKIALAKLNIVNYLNRIVNKEIIINDLMPTLSEVKSMSEMVDKINFCGNRGKYSVSYDNGYSTYCCSISIRLDENNFRLSVYDFLSEDYPTDARSDKMIDERDAGMEYLQGGRSSLECFFRFYLDWEIVYSGCSYR